MNTANKLTLVRIGAVPVLLLLLSLGRTWALWTAVGVYIVACVTDTLDGYVARRYNQVSNFGKFMDPLADKMLVLSVMCVFVQRGQMAGWVLAVVLLREFGVSGLRLLAVERGQVIAAAWSGKLKTLVTMICLGFMIPFHWDWLDLTAQALILLTTVASGAEYFWKNRALFRGA